MQFVIIQVLILRGSCALFLRDKSVVALISRMLAVQIIRIYFRRIRDDPEEQIRLHISGKIPPDDVILQLT